MRETDDYEVENQEAILKLDISWGVRGDNLNPDEITTALAMPPSHVWRRGEQYQMRNGRIAERPWTVWQIRSEGKVISDKLNDHAEFLLGALEPKNEVIRQLREKAEYCDVRVWYELFADGCNNVASFGMRANFLARLAALASDVNFSVVLMPKRAAFERKNQSG